MTLVDTSVLVVDDDLAFRGLALRILRSCGFEIAGEAATVAAGMTAALSLRPDAILVDVRLPDGSGIDLGRELAALPWLPRVVLTSSDSGAADEIAAQEDGSVMAFVPKDELPNAPLVRLLAGD
jgi:CheY-like chemotaxis protein